MTINKAIEILTIFIDPNVTKLDPDDLDAIKLGIEALKRIKDMRISPCTTADELLPGEGFTR